MTQNAINNTASIMAIDNITIDGNTISSTDANGDVVIAPNGSGTISVTTAPIVPSGDRADSLGSATNSWDNVYADGLTFDDGTNIMSNYVESAWTPVLSFGGGSVGITYTFQLGNYTRIGNVVMIRMLMQLSSKGSSNGNAVVAGLPLTSVAGTTNALAFGFWGPMNLDANFFNVGGLVGASATSFTVYQSGDNAAARILTDAEFANNTTLRFCSWYSTS